MSLLLDTRVLIWAATSPEKIRPIVLDAMRETEVFVSSISAYEMTLKSMRGRLPIAQRLLADLSGYP